MRNETKIKIIGRKTLEVSLIFALLVICTIGNQVTINVFAVEYRTYNALIGSFKNFATTYPSLVSYEVIGKTVQKNDILMFKIGNSKGVRVLFDGAMHGDETLGSELLYFYAKWLLTSNDPLAKRILSEACTLIIPALNVDKYGINRKNANGVDLNRNFATCWDSAGSTDPNSWHYRGTAPLSETESQTIINVLREYKPSFYVNLHMWQGPYYAGSYYGNNTYYSVLKNKINSLSKELGVTPLPYAGQFKGAGFAISDAALMGVTSFLIELAEEFIPYSDIEKALLPRFIPIAAVLSQEINSQIIFEDNFESGDFNKWSGVTITKGCYAEISTDIRYSGSFSAKFETEASVSTVERSCVYKQIEESSTVYARAYFYIASEVQLNNDDDRFTLIQFLNNEGGFIGNLQIRRIKGQNRFAILAFNKLISTTVIYPKANAWYCLELFTKIHSVEGAVKAYINGVECLSITNIDTSGLGKVSVIRFGLANSIGIESRVTVYCDSAKISTSYIGLQ